MGPPTNIEPVHPVYDKLAVGRRIRAFRKMRKWTQQQMGDYLGVDRELVSKWERGNTYAQQDEVALLMDRDGLDFNFVYGGRLSTLSHDLREQLLPFLEEEARDHVHVLYNLEMLRGRK